MYLDRQNQYSDAQALTVTVASTDIIDHGPLGGENTPTSNLSRDLGTGEPMVVMINLTVAADNTTTDETYTATLQTDALSAFGSPTTVGSVLVIPAGSAAGSKFFIDIPIGVAIEQFTRINYTLGGTTPSVTLDARLVPRSFVEDTRDYESGFVV